MAFSAGWLILALFPWPDIDVNVEEVRVCGQCTFGLGDGFTPAVYVFGPA